MSLLVILPSETDSSKCSFHLTVPTPWPSGLCMLAPSLFQRGAPVLHPRFLPLVDIMGD